MATYYLDTSALAKTVLSAEQGATALSRLRGPGDQWLTSDLGRTETARVLMRRELPPTAIFDALRGIAVIQLTRDTYDLAGRLQPARLRSLDAIHVAAALSLGPELTAVVTYDARMAEAARLNGLTVLSPGVDAL